MDKLKKFSSDFLLTLTANFVNLGFNAVLVLVLPKVLSEVDYGQWQFYIMCAQFIGYLTLGITDGVYIRYGGQDYDNLPKARLRSQFWLLFLIHLISDFFIYIYALNFLEESKVFIFAMMCLAGILYVPKTLITFSLQASSRIKDYSFITIMEKIYVLIVIIVLVLFKVEDYRYYVLSDLLGKALSLIQAAFTTPDLVKGKLPSCSEMRDESKLNFQVGIQVLIANLASLLINGLVRIIVENRWGIVAFGKISLALSIANIITTMILAVSVVFFPTLKRAKEENYSYIFQEIRNVLTLPIALMLMIYFPMAAILTAWIPRYADSLKILGLIFPLTIFESNVKLLANNYFKALHKESFLMLSNIATILISVGISSFTAFVLNNLTLTVVSIVLVHFIRALVSEIYLNKLLKINTVKNIVLDLLLTIAFMFSAWILEWYLGLLIYLMIYLIFVFMKADELKRLIGLMRSSRKGDSGES